MDLGIENGILGVQLRWEVGERFDIEMRVANYASLCAKDLILLYFDQVG